MFQNKMSLRLRIFISMILLVFTATLLVLGSTYYQYRTESDQYNSYRQERKESQLKRQINYIVNKYNLSENYDLWEDYQSDFEEITRIHSVEYSIFKIDGTPGKQNTFSTLNPGAPLVGFKINSALCGIQTIFCLPSLNSPDL